MFQGLHIRGWSYGRWIPSFSLLVISCLVVNQNVVSGADEFRDSVRRAVERGLTVLERGARAYPSHQSCFSCHHQTLPMLAMATAKDVSLRFDVELFREQRNFTHKSFDERKTRLARGEHVGGRAATVSYGLWAMHIAQDPTDEVGEAMAEYLLSVQEPDGRWKPPSNRPPLEVSAVSCTVLSAIGVKRFAGNTQKVRVNEAISRAMNWLATAALDEQEDLNFALWGEVLLGGSKDRISTLRDKVLAARQVDGGWSQNKTLTSDAYATGQTLFVLAEAGFPVQEAAYREGVAFLLGTQTERGSWHVTSRSKPIQPWFDNGDPHDKDQFISIAATGWATAALAKSLR